jgi:hypothetical protein
MPEAEGATEDTSAKKLRSAGETDPALLSSIRQLPAFGDSLDRQLQSPPPEVLPDADFEDHNLDTQRKPLRRLSPRGRSTE